MQSYIITLFSGCVSENINFLDQSSQNNAVIQGKKESEEEGTFLLLGPPTVNLNDYLNFLGKGSPRQNVVPFLFQFI